MKKTLIITGIVIAAAILILIIIGRISAKKEITSLYVESQKGQFDIIVNTTGELQAKESTDIYGPQFTESRNIRAMEIKITDMVPEGTEVKEGDYVATLDRTSFENNLKDELEKLTTLESNLEMKILDTAVNLSNLRDNLKNLSYSVEEAKITLQQSKFEPPTTIRQAELSLDKAIRSLDQSTRSYTLKVEQANSDIKTLLKNINDQQTRVRELEDILSKFIIRAPAPGMVIYKRDRMGTKRKIGSSISPWDNVVATLPDMSVMISKTYVNEIDVSKVFPGQSVEILVDAFPDKNYTGVVKAVANIGEQLPNTDAKVFEVTVQVNESDPILKPAMTTGNKIITKSINDVVYIPLESVYATADSIPFVYLKGGYRQVVVLGEMNENSVVVEKGLEENEKIYLNVPEKADKFKMKGEELIAVIKERVAAKKAEEQRKRDEAERAAREKGFLRNLPPSMQSKFQGVDPSLAGQSVTGDSPVRRIPNQNNNNTRQLSPEERQKFMERRAAGQQRQSAPGDTTMRRRRTEQRSQ
ncbi:MAG: efflux RND transporter periplasmic adaptor subunit [Bacteroidales bacterium]|nr:efflux RND transporter periplasmic adaptor subunit [Bacteroidales bacterium]MDD2425877.1 efflux RND transporter periplasmic adaptor subunit [Bacteroidales bacterium]MDD3989665.1 efflux RND transporter periplasmic adaptor subunit [Bacteroidales bacterium]MDD4638604.1 efflux RND transporter periplasmic adaptor subunit [Bacteroidales bacterium]